MSTGVPDEQLDELEAALLALDRVSVKRLLGDGAARLTPIERVEQWVVPVLERMGTGWDEGRVSLSQVYMSGRLCEELVDQILPPCDSARHDFPPMAIAVLEDYHLLGMRIVYSALRASGFALRNYGRCEVGELVDRVKADGIQILLISVLMLPSALRVRDLRACLAEAGCVPRVVVGGAPFRFDSQLATEVGADASGVSAADAVAAVNGLVEAMR